MGDIANLFYNRPLPHLYHQPLGGFESRSGSGGFGGGGLGRAGDGFGGGKPLSGEDPFGGLGAGETDRLTESELAEEAPEEER